MLDDIIKN